MLDSETSGTYCPYCGEHIQLVIDCSVAEQEYIEDCEVCCRPMTIKVQINANGHPNLSVFHENEA